VRSTTSAGSGQAWAIVLAAGEGMRLRSLTADGAGNTVPKQFCSLDGRTSLLTHTLTRAAAVVARERISAIVAPTHRRYWQSSLSALPASNIVVQPANRGTAIGILLPALRIARHDPNANIVILPSDHYVADERVLEIAIRRALEEIGDHARGVALLGIEAEEPDAELGYVVPKAGTGATFGEVQRFVEKPPLVEARRLCANGALWNSFILVCRVQSLVKLYMPRCPDVVEILQDTDLGEYEVLSELYRELSPVDFSHQIATGQEEHLAVMSVPPCGWNDLGTPRRLAHTILRHREHITARTRSRLALENPIDLAERLLQAHPNYAADLLTGTA
jgi:mannose-1-phosphate guanylyltransferase